MEEGGAGHIEKATNTRVGDVGVVGRKVSTPVCVKQLLNKGGDSENQQNKSDLQRNASQQLNNAWRNIVGTHYGFSWASLRVTVEVDAPFLSRKESQT